MALVMLPSDFPSWTTVEKKLKLIQNSEDVQTVLECMKEIHELCNISLDPDDDIRDNTFLKGLERILKQDKDSKNEASEFLEVIKIIAKHAQTIKSLRPPRGLSFSLQQEASCTELDRCFVAALLANAFFSTFPKRTKKTHPTLQDFNFTNFFHTLDSNSQKAKFDCLIKYFRWLDQQKSPSSTIKFSRKVMPGKHWLTIEDWIECNFPLCPVDVKHYGQIGNCFDGAAQAIFSSPHIGGKALQSGKSEQCFQLFMCPESLASLLFVEALEDNEAFLIEDVNQFFLVMDTKNKAIVEMLPEVRKVSLCCFDAENYKILPINQFEEDNVLRELNKCLLAFRQNSNCKITESRDKKARKRTAPITRLSPIGESGSSTPNDSSMKIVVQQPTPNRSLTDLSDTNGVKDRKHWLDPNVQSSGPVLSAGGERRGRFIVLGSSGEYLPVNREDSVNRWQSSLYSSCDSDEDDDEEFHSARQSLEDSDEENAPQHDAQDDYEKRKLFVDKLKEAFKQSSNYTDSTASSYAVGISLSGSRDDEEVIRLKRGGSTGFVLPEDSLDGEFRRTVLEQDLKQWPNLFTKKSMSQRKDSNDSSNYSFSTDCSSELEEVLQRFSKWLCDAESKETSNEADPRNKALMNFANSLLKRTLSESFVGFPLTDGCTASTADALMQEFRDKKSRPVLGIKSLSLELAKFKNCLATRSIGNRDVSHGRNLRPVATGNWGCGSSQLGFVQFKLVIQWMAASVAGLPVLIYYTNAHPDLTKLDTVIRVLRDRKWTVGELASASLKFAKENVEKSDHLSTGSRDFFEKLIGL